MNTTPFFRLFLVLVAFCGSMLFSAVPSTSKVGWQGALAKFSKTGNWEDLKSAYNMASDIPEIPELENWDEIKLEKVVALFMVCKQAGDAIDPKFDFSRANRPVMNVSPPDATGLPAGIDPKRIKDDKLREEYISAIKLNREKGDLFEKQIKLRQIYNQAIRYLTACVDRVAEAGKEKELITLAEKITGVSYEKLEVVEYSFR